MPFVKLIGEVIADHWRLLLEVAIVLLGWHYYNAYQSEERAHEQTRIEWKAQVKAADDLRIVAEETGRKAVSDLVLKHDQEMKNARDLAETNWRKYLDAVRAARVRDRQPQTPSSDSQVPSAGTPDEASPDSYVIDASVELARICGETTRLYDEWRELCNKQPLACEVVKGEP